MRLRLGGLGSESKGRNLAICAGLAFFFSNLFFIGAEVYEASEKQNLKAASSSELEVQSDQVIDQKCKASQDCIIAAGITTVSNADQFTQKANQSRATAETMRVSAGGALACAAGLGIAAAARQRRENQLEAEDTRQFSKRLYGKRVAMAHQRWDATASVPEAVPSLEEKIAADHGKLNIEIFDFSHGTDFAGISEEVAGLRKDLLDMSVDFGAPDPTVYQKIVQEEADAKMWATIEDTSPERARLWLELREEQAAVRREREEINEFLAEYKPSDANWAVAPTLNTDYPAPDESIMRQSTMRLPVLPPELVPA